jgi:hypothetical protein
MRRRLYSPQAVHRRAMQRGQDKADDEYYAERARKREAEEKSAVAQPTTEGEKNDGQDQQPV